MRRWGEDFVEAGHLYTPRAPLTMATKPCPSCTEQAAATGESALGLCNSKRIKAYDRETEMMEYRRSVIR